MGAVIIHFRHEDFRQAVEIPVVWQHGINKLLHGGNAVLFQHDQEHLRVDDRAGVEKFHAKILATDETQMKLRFQAMAMRLLATPVFSRAFCKVAVLNC